jgi:hypothetical protein
LTFTIASTPHFILPRKILLLTSFYKSANSIPTTPVKKKKATVTDSFLSLFFRFSEDLTWLFTESTNWGQLHRSPFSSHPHRQHRNLTVFRCSLVFVLPHHRRILQSL